MLRCPNQQAALPAPNAQARLDLIGALAASACAVHCLAVPLVLVVLPLAGAEAFHSETFDQGFALAASLFGGWMARSGWRRHRDWSAVSVYLLAVTLLLVGAFGFGAHHDAADGVVGHGHGHAHGHAVGHALLLAGGGFLMACAHWRNRRLTLGAARAQLTNISPGVPLAAAD